MSVTIISDSGFMSDALSTACFVLGLEDGMAYAKKKGVEAIFITQDKKVYTTDGLKKTFRITEDSYELSD
jgi:thiamine biosynthesis lipoprotein